MILNTRNVLPTLTSKSKGRYSPFPSINGLFCFVYGTLGIITKVAVRVYFMNELTITDFLLTKDNYCRHIKIRVLRLVEKNKD